MKLSPPNINYFVMHVIENIYLNIQQKPTPFLQYFTRKHKTKSFVHVVSIYPASVVLSIALSIGVLIAAFVDVWPLIYIY